MNIPRPVGTISWRAAFLWFGMAVAVACLGSYLAYGPVTSDAWQCWSGRGAWRRDALRVLLSALLAIVLLHNLGAVSAHTGSNKLSIELKLSERSALLAALAILLVFELTALPNSFAKGLASRNCIPYSGFRQIYLPYIPYTLYMMGLWIGVAFPNFLFLMRSVPADIRWSRGNWETLRSVIERSNDHSPELLAQSYRRLVTAFEEYVLGLKGLAQRYIPVILVIAIILLYEQLTRSHLTVTTAAVEAGKIGLWILLGPALLLCLLLVVFRYQDAAQATTWALSRIAANPTADPQLFESAIAKRSELAWKRGTFQFVLSLFQSATFTIAFIVAAFSYVLSSTIRGERVIDALFPRPIVQFVEHLFN
jgi:hypothetical protein